jgi:hypothetical protein
MNEPLALAAAEAAVADKRRLLAAEGDQHRGELSRALLELSRALQGADRDDDALAAAEESVRVLAPAFLARPAWFAAPMRAVIAQYVALAQRLRRGPDEALLAPLAQALGDLARAEDAGEDDGP